MFFLFKLVVMILKRDKPKYKQIIDAAIIVIAENGYHHAQVSKIAKKAGVADGTIYLYFENKEDILISVFSEIITGFIDSLKKILEQEVSIDSKLFEIIDNHFKLLAANRYIATVTQIEIRQSTGELRAKINPILKEYLNLLEEVLKAGVASGELSSTLDIRLARQMIFGVLDGISTNWVMNEFRYDLVEQASKVHNLLFNGIKA